MRSIPTLFQRDEKSFRAVKVVTPGCEWVLAGEGRATRKWDGTACMVKDGRLYRRYDGSDAKCQPPGFITCASDGDELTSHWTGWVPVGREPEGRWHREAVKVGLTFDRYVATGSLADSTYQLCGPKV